MTINRMFLDIPLHKVDKIEIKQIGGEEIEVDQEDWKEIINALNSIEEKNVDWEMTNDDTLVGAYTIYLYMLVESEQIIINYGPWSVIGMAGAHHFVDLNHEIFDIFRELDLKYATKYLDYEEFMDWQKDEVHGFADRLFDSCICAPKEC